MAGPVPVGLSDLLGLLVGVGFIAYGILRFGRSVDGLWSVTHIQTILWTGVILGSYLALSLAAWSFLSDVPTNTLVLIGIATGTLAFSNIVKGIQNNPVTPRANAYLGGFLASEKFADRPSMVKMQMFAWNLIAVLLFAIFVGANLNSGNYTLPDIGATMSAIIGISNGAHVAAKTVGA